MKYKRDGKLSMKMSEEDVYEIKAHASNSNMSLHDFIISRCITIQDKIWHEALMGRISRENESSTLAELVEESLET